MGHVSLGWEVGSLTLSVSVYVDRGSLKVGRSERDMDSLTARYPSLLMRMLGLRLVPSSPHLAKMVSYEFMNRQLVWGAFTVRNPTPRPPL